MPYPKAETWTFDLGAVGAKELLITLTDPRVLPAGRRREYAKAQLTLLRMRHQGIIPERAEGERALAVFDELFLETVQSWNLPFPDNWPEKKLRGKVIPLDYAGPDGAVDPLYPVPGEVYDAIVNTVVERLSSPPKSP